VFITHPSFIFLSQRIVTLQFLHKTKPIGKQMTHSEILSLVEKSISPDAKIVSIEHVQKLNVESPDVQVIPGKKSKLGLYGIIDLRLAILLPEVPDRIMSIAPLGYNPEKMSDLPEDHSLKTS
jgi:hypothetical protein